MHEQLLADIDAAIRAFGPGSGREIFPASEVYDVLLDLRSKVMQDAERTPVLAGNVL